MKDYSETNYSDILEKALAEGKSRQPNEPLQHHAAFANSVAYLVTGASGGYGGPSCREHAVSHAAQLQGGGQQATVGDFNAFVPGPDTGIPGQWSYESACDFAEPICYGPIQEIHFACYRTEHCFDDSQEDIEALKKFSVGNANH